MKILLSNDDGYFAPGIQTVFQSLRQNIEFSRLDIMAPERNRSAASNSLTLLEPLRMNLHTSLSDDPRCHVYSVNGTPTDCVHLGMNGGLDYQPDIVLSGINAGANMGDDVLYSGTVAAATEGRFLGKPSVAISLCGNQHFDTAAYVLLKFLQDMPGITLAQDTIININVPDIPLAKLKGIKVTRLGKRHISEPVVKQVDPRGLPIYWIGPAGEAADAGEGTDFHAVENGYASVTPLKIDLSHYEMMETLHDWEKGLSLD
ncbi:5'/3'-nucleotidase SurE [Thiomicrorhabdus lithotrophica]|uniref:5'-nucleotidase SurE n=1 Tax=Thiomicrorhabdus lithotrophica TaxID=2949997 RepID=A0ABY8CGE0_9GAMM|nr:5'/3'-nucleotidase SurE [Thiomicrorhabdus lithotrophica]WEJ63765.1 5'/3'-nucleotidase SurE [Thiomicrorhabdus lithotrophica]